MSQLLTRSQKQDLGKALAKVGYAPSAFVYNEEPVGNGDDVVAILTNRETSDRFMLARSKSGKYGTRQSVPGTSRMAGSVDLTWGQVAVRLQSWAREVKLESEAIDPWQQEAEDMADDDSNFTPDELPKVYKAIEASLDELKQRAIEHGVSQKKVEAEIQEVRQLLEKSARTSTKKEWITLFKGIIVEKLVSWGMQTALFQGILQTLITSAHDIAQFTEHASRHLLN